MSYLNQKRSSHWSTRMIYRRYNMQAT